MVWECVGFSTEEHGENGIRHREYTTSEIKAELWGEIPRIQFTDSGHGIEFHASRHSGGRSPEKRGLRDHVDENLKRLRAERRRG